MKKIIRLTESDLTRIVKRILKEQPKDFDKPGFFNGWTEEEKNFYNKLPNKDDDYYNYTSQEVLDSIRTRMETAATLGAGKEKREQGLVQLGDEPGYASKPKTENAGQKGDPNWYTKFPCINGEQTKDFPVPGETTPGRVFYVDRGISIVFFYDGSTLSVTPIKDTKIVTIKFWYCEGNDLKYSDTSMYNVWVPKSDPRSQAQKYYDDYLPEPKVLR